MDKFEYAELEQREYYGNFYFFLGATKLGEEYASFTLVEALNLIGQEGWQLVATIGSDHFIVMRKVEGLL